jgi:hypothetical protein
MYSAYENWHSTAGSDRCLEISTLTDTEYAQALENSETAAITLQDSENQPFEVPIAVPLECLEWYNEVYFRKAASVLGFDTTAPIVYYDHLSTLVASERAAYVEALAQVVSRVAEKKGLLVTDTLDDSAAQVLGEFTSLLSGLHYSARDALPSYDTEPLHYHYASPTTLSDPRQVRTEALGLWDAANSGIQLAEGVSVEQALSEEDGETVWQYYDERFDELTAVDPIRAGSPKEELLSIFQNEQILKFVQRIGGEVVSMALWADARDVPWVPSGYFLDHTPAEYQNGQVWFSPGAITKRKSGGNIATVMRAVGRVSTATGAESSILSFVCDKVSRPAITSISNRAFNGAGLMTDTTKPVRMRRFHAFQLTKVSA